ncbi:MAG: hypothetical protein K0S56_2158 [Microvirga sp.]|jgi:hypothetical protein|nr:hypothetical protein [Microvirga sp.]
MSDETRIEHATTDRRTGKTARQRWVTMPGGERRYSDLPAGEIAELLRKRSKLGAREAKLQKAERGG